MKTIPVTKVLIALILFTSCSSSQIRPSLMSEKDFVENERIYSPDKTMLILNYSWDTGAFGYARGGSAVLKSTDLSKDLRQFHLPENLIRLKWIDNKTISGDVDIIPSIRSGEPVEIRDTEVNGIKVKVSPFDHIEKTSRLKIEHRETSPNGEFELVAYRYPFGNDLIFIHVSVIKKGDSIPKYGNYYIGDMSSDRILFGSWTEDNTLLFYSNSLYTELVQYFLVHDRPDIRFEVVVDDERYGNKYRWVKEK